MATNTALNNMIGLCTVTDKDTTNHVLNAGSSFYQQYTNTMFSSGDTVQLPVTSTLMLGRTFTIFNSDPFFDLPVNSSGGNLIATIGVNSQATFSCVDLTVTDATGWMFNGAFPGVITASSSPTITFSTPGNLTVSYSAQQGSLYQVGPLMYLEIAIRFTPTYTSASGNIIIQNLPAGIGNSFDAIGGGGLLVTNGITGVVSPFAYPASVTTVTGNLISNFGSPQITLQGLGSNINNALLGTTQFPTASARFFKLQFAVANP